nr:hypothetical protein [Tanacetum cinerariifolium]
MQADISSIKGMVTETFQAFKGISSSTPLETTKEAEFGHVEMEPKVEDVEMEHVQAPQVTQPIPITIVKLITWPNPEVEMIGSSSRRHLTNTILEILIPRPETQHTTPKPNKGNDIARDTNESPRKLVKASSEEAKLLEMNKSELIKVFNKEATKAEVDPKILASAKGGQDFRKIQDVQIKVLNKEHSENIKKSRELEKEGLISTAGPQVTMQADISSVKGMVNETFQAFKGISSSTPLETTKEAEFGHVEMEPKVEDVEIEHVQAPQVTQPIPITIVKLITWPNPEIEMIGSSSRRQLTNTILEILIPRPETQHTTPKPNKGKDIARDTNESPRKLVKASSEVHPNPDALVPVKEAKLLEMNKSEMIKVFHKEAAKAGVDPKILASAKGGQDFRKIQDVQIKVLNKEHSENIKKSRELEKEGLIRRKRKIQELEPETRIPGSECNRSLFGGIPFFNNLVIEQLENRMFFIDVFGDEAFQRMSDIH